MQIQYPFLLALAATLLPGQTSLPNLPQLLAEQVAEVQTTKLASRKLGPVQLVSAHAIVAGHHAGSFGFVARNSAKQAIRRLVLRFDVEDRSGQVASSLWSTCAPPGGSVLAPHGTLSVDPSTSALTSQFHSRRPIKQIRAHLVLVETADGRTLERRPR